MLLQSQDGSGDRMLLPPCTEAARILEGSGVGLLTVDIGRLRGESTGHRTLVTPFARDFDKMSVYMGRFFTPLSEGPCVRRLWG